MTTLLSIPASTKNFEDCVTFTRRALLPHDPDFLWQIQAGVIRTLTWHENGTVVTTGIWGPGDLVGSVLSTADPYEIECLTEVKAQIVPRSHWHQVASALVLHIQRSDEFLRTVHSRNVESSIVQLLNLLGKRFGREVEQGQLIDLRLTHQDISELIGTTRVTVTRILGNFKKQGIIQRQQGLLVMIPDREPFWHYEI